MSSAVLGFDFGEKRIGVAVGDLQIGIAHAIAVLPVSTNALRLAAVEKLVKEWQPSQLVIGEPSFEDGNPHPIAHLAHKFGNRLKERFRLPVHYINETLSSSEAAARLRQQGIRGREQQIHLDAAAAQVILQSFLDTQPRERSPHAA